MNEIDIFYRLFDLDLYYYPHWVKVGKNYALHMPFRMMQQTTFLRKYF